METVDRGKIGVFTVYSRKEADELHLDYVHWKDVVEQRYALTDDGYVVDVLRVQTYTDRHRKHTRTLITLSVGKGFVTRGSRIEYLENKKFTSWSTLKPQSWQSREAKRSRTKNAVKVYVKQVMSGHVDWDQVGGVYRPDQLIRAATVKRLFHEKEIQDMVDVELSKECQKRGIDKGFILDTIKKAIEIAQNREDPGNMIKGADQLADYLGMNQVNSAPQLMEFGITREIGEQIDKIDKELTDKTAVEATSETLDE